jgi:RimJ/RimL family protein N-acetyltransferase
MRDATIDDCRFVYDVNTHPSVRTQSINREPIPYDEHCTWFAAQLDASDRYLWIAMNSEGATDVGVVRFDLHENGSAGTISIALAPSARGQGLGRATIHEASRRLSQRLGINTIVALVRPANLASLAAFRGAGYRDTGRTEIERGITLKRLMWNSPTQPRD